ncbi:MAG: DASH family cryptochrome [Saprospiraceae bacterium]|nr:DASH family cryptochrome [Saprospiraceae bacterium]
MKRSIVWFRNDLRVHDNEALVDAIKHSDEIVPVYILDPRIIYGKTSFGFRKRGRFRAQFLIEALTDLRSRLQALNSNLYIRIGHPEDVIPQLARACRTHYVYCNRERTQEEVDVQDALEQKLWSIGQEMRYYRGKMLYYTADLPFPITHCPDQFTQFRKEVEKIVKVRLPHDAPICKLDSLSIELEEGDIPSLEELDYKSSASDYTQGHRFVGGETAGLAELNYYVWDSHLIKKYKETRNGLLGRDYSSKFSAYLSLGCLSPKLVYNEISKYENEHGSNDSTYWLKFELMWRDFFRFMGKKHGNSIFRLTGTRNIMPDFANDNMTLFEKWKDARTGIPFIDSNMRELNTTGFMSNRGRQLVASFLVKDMKLNWLMGAEYFESMLVDYDPCSNYGNWNYVAGVGADTREDRYFMIPSQARRYDPQAEYIKYWLPELETIAPELLFNPFEQEASLALQQVDYTQPCVHIKNW